ncbi:hypothetical protein GCM10023093_21920 [Nemorincola caseinilytica]|uniref:Glycosyltransferase RgtA/B/C/D-like domain-containing protein n=2 Tax=Nemorincola caseinilytica TaxID=2054315 RepID=A0ABP8NII6_9BACT
MPTQQIRIDLSGWGWYCGITAIALAAGLWQWQMMPPAYDEIFSAVNASAMHPFRTLSYYMLPNNHILFNVLNGLLFGWHQHLVGTGRVLSLLAYVGISLTCFRWLYGLMNSRPFAFIATLCIMFQFATWGMSAQARGYECQLLCGWLAFASLYAFVQRQRGTYMRINALANLAGYALIPSWSYCYMAQLLFVAPYLLWNRHMALRYMRYQAATLACVFLFYLPALCFSGKAALTGNKYVRPAHMSAFLPQFAGLGKNFISHCFSGLAAEGSILSYILFAMPLLLLFTGRKMDRLVTGFYVAIWAGYLVVSLLVRHTPFHRTLIVQFSISMGIVAYTCFVMAGIISTYARRIRMTVMILLFAIPMLSFSIYELRYDRNNVNFGLYGNDVNGIHNGITRDLGIIPAGSTIAFSEESFYCYYHCHRLGYKASRCATGTEEYYIKRTDEPLPPSMAAYSLLQNIYDDHQVYKRN